MTLTSVLRTLMNCLLEQARVYISGSVQRKLSLIAQGWWILLIALVIFGLYLPKWQVQFFGKFKLQKDCNQSCWSKRVLGLIEMTCGLVHSSYSLPEWQAVTLTFFAP